MGKLGGSIDGLRAAMSVALGAGLAWFIVSHSFAAYFAETDPELTLILNPHQPSALVRLAKSRLIPLLNEADAAEPARSNETDRLSSFATRRAVGAAHSEAHDISDDGSSSLEATRAEIRSLAERALAADPLNASALYVLGWSADAEGDPERATRLMQAAVKRSFRETAAAYHLLLKSFDAREHGQVLDYADAILRTAPEMTRYIVPIVARVAEDESAKGLLQQRLAGHPPWRGAILAALPGAVTDARTPLNLLLALRDAGAPPGPAELRGYIDFLIRHKFYELAYYTWLQFLSAEDLARTGLLYNGSFERPLSGLPFDWVIRRSSGATVQVTSAAGVTHGQALLIEFGYGRIDFGGVSQMVLLAPGNYRFKGRLKGELAGRRGLVWRAFCVGGRKLLGESDMMIGMAPAWRTFGFTFTVPQDPSCRAQEVRLALDARSASERLVSGAVWYADLTIERL